MKSSVSLKGVLKRHKWKIVILLLLSVFVLAALSYIFYSYQAYPGRLPDKYKGTLVEALYENKRLLDDELSFERIVGKWIPANSDLGEVLHYLESIGFTVTGTQDHGEGKFDVYLVNFVSSNFFLDWQFMVTLSCSNGVIVSRSASVLKRSL